MLYLVSFQLLVPTNDFDPCNFKECTINHIKFIFMQNVGEMFTRRFENPAEKLVYDMIIRFFYGFKEGIIDMALDNSPSCMEAATDLVTSNITKTFLSNVNHLNLNFLFTLQAY